MCEPSLQILSPCCSLTACCLNMIKSLPSVNIREGNGTPLQYSCLEDPMGGGAQWAAVHGVAKSQTRLKRLSSSSSNVY